MTMSNRILRKAVDRRTMLKAATGAAAGFYAWGIPGKSYQRALAQDERHPADSGHPGTGRRPDRSRYAASRRADSRANEGQCPTGEFQGPDNSPSSVSTTPGSTT